MSQIENKMLFLAVILIICGVSQAAVYKVGDSSGWTNTSHLDYKSWAASKQFHVGDTIEFHYNKELSNVVRVTHKNFRACNATSPFKTWTSGNDSFTIRRTGHFFFISSLSANCENGQKVDIRVPGAPGPKAAPPQSPSPYPAPLSPSPSDEPLAPAPAPSSATRSWAKNSFLVAAIVSMFWF